MESCMLGLGLIVVTCIAAGLSLPFGVMAVVGLKRVSDSDKGDLTLNRVALACLLVVIVIWMAACLLMARLRV